ncbi:MAG TPA: hypothetical protein VET24_09380 [Actinomycetota bacterium]|nr:hypothetical protein [Actinomycetota bacterium]
MSGAAPREVQVIWPAGDDGSFPPLDVAARLGGEAHSVDPASCPRRIPAFPTEVPFATLASAPAPTPAPEGCLVIGLGGPELEPVAVDLEREGPHLLVAGGDRTGRSTALATCLASARAADPGARVVVLAPRPSPLRNLPGVVVATTPDEINQALSCGTRCTLLVIDDCEALPPESAFALNDALRSSRTGGLRALVAGRTADLLRLYDDWARYLRSLRCGILLNPEEADGELFDVALPRRLPPRVPGRGYLVRGRKLDAVQVALPPAPVSAPRLPRHAPVPSRISHRSSVSGERSA